MSWSLFLLIFLLNTLSCSLGSNLSSELVVTEEFSKWVKRMSSSTHSAFKKADNVHKACLRITVERDPLAGDFVSLQEAINYVPEFTKCRVVISVGAGIYSEKVTIPSSKPFITLEGAGADKTIIQWADNAKRVGSNGNPLSTYNTSTVAIDADYFIAKKISFKNTAPLPRTGEEGTPGVAVRISGDAAMFINCKFHGAQDTLYDHKGRHYFKNCYIEGTVDFIFGNGLSIYDNCEIHAIGNSDGAFTAQRRDNMLDDTGFSFIRCKVTGSGASYLGRAWGTFSRVVFAYTFMDKIVTPRGWENWGDKNREMTVFYGQYRCTGPGADFAGRVSWSRELTSQEARPFLSLNYIDGYEWLELQ
ncbi:probable pectinesterase 53 [Aristolochia californica]|uniref:probable pectinesterase 53 n=1 Tax=Aristolochia californica TaxID=171875 RepID=UPI0035D845F0